MIRRLDYGRNRSYVTRRRDFPRASVEARAGPARPAGNTGNVLAPAGGPGYRPRSIDPSLC